MPSCLTRLELQGYKTFASKTDFEFGDITCIVGPNGSGKSNIADALRWVLGEQSYQLLRGRKTEDMIFSGSDKRPKASMAAVTVVFDNSDGWLPIEFSEVSLTRRAYRDGNNEYLLNGNKVRLRDIADLLGKVGLGRRTYTIIGQGLVDSALSLKADERRALFEEAAGIGTYRLKREESLRKLDLTERNLERVQDIMGEIRPRLRALERQATRAQEHQKALVKFHTEMLLLYGYHWHYAHDLVRLALSETDARAKALEDLRTLQASKEEDIARLRTNISAQREKLNSKRSEAARYQNELETARRQLAVAEERARNLEHHQQATSDQFEQFESILVAQRQKLSEARDELPRLENDRDELQNQIATAQEKVDQREAERRTVADRVAGFRSRAADIAQQIIELHARRTALGERLQQLTEEGSELEHALQDGRAAISELQDALAHQVGIATQPRDSEEDDSNEEGSKLEGENGIGSELAKLASKVSDALSEVERLTTRQGRKIGDELSNIDAELEEMEVERGVAEQHAGHEGERLDDLKLEDQENQITGLRTNLAVAHRALQDHSARCAELSDALERDQRLINARPDQTYSLTTELETLARDIENLDSRESSLHTQHIAIKGEIEPIETEIASIEAIIGENERHTAGEGETLHAAERSCAEAEIEHERKQSKLTALHQQISEDLSLLETETIAGIESSVLHSDVWIDQLKRVSTLPEGLQEKVDRVRNQVRRLGGSNTEAVEEYTEVKKRYEHLETQVDDLRLASDHLHEVIDELDTLMQRDFHQTFESVAKEFQYTFERLFGGGTAHLELTNPDDLSHTGIEILAQLPGRREQGLALLSGGERSLTACALVFALLRISPTPFAMLDEVDAMLDETNVGRFREILAEIGETTQFVVITHNRHTVEVADTVYGVSMGTDSASQVISLRLD